MRNYYGNKLILFFKVCVYIYILLGNALKIYFLKKKLLKCKNKWALKLANLSLDI